MRFSTKKTGNHIQQISPLLSWERGIYLNFTGTAAIRYTGTERHQKDGTETVLHLDDIIYGNGYPPIRSLPQEALSQLRGECHAIEHHSFPHASGHDPVDRNAGM
jgi:hypothetical protein